MGWVCVRDISDPMWPEPAIINIDQISFIGYPETGIDPLLQPKRSEPKTAIICGGRTVIVPGKPGGTAEWLARNERQSLDSASTCFEPALARILKEREGQDAEVADVEPA